MLISYLFTFVISFGCSLGQQVLILVFVLETKLMLGFTSHTWRFCQALVWALLLEV